MSTTKMPERIWATLNGMSTRLPDGKRQLIGGWSEDPERDHVTEFVRADLAKGAMEACEAMASDYQTSAGHHPEHVLVRVDSFEAMRAALSKLKEAGL